MASDSIELRQALRRSLQVGGAIPTALKRPTLAPIAFRLVEEVPTPLAPFDPSATPPKASDNLQQKQHIEDEGELLEFWREQFTLAKMSVEDTTPQKTWAAWRIIRFIAEIKEQVSNDEFLIEGLQSTRESPDQWRIPAMFPDRAVPAIAAPIARILVESQRLTDPDFCVVDGNERLWPGIPLLPPPVPVIWEYEDGSLAEDYEPGNTKHDPNLHSYCDLLLEAISILHIAGGTPEDPVKGQLALQYLTHPATVRLTFPGSLQIMAFEEALADETLQRLVDDGPRRTRIALHAKWGLQSFEITRLIKLARQMAVRRSDLDPEEARALMQLRLEAYIQRSAKCSDLKAEMNGLKLLAMVQGLTRTDPEDSFAEFTSVVVRVAEEASKRIPTGDIISVEPTTAKYLPDRGGG